MITYYTKEGKFEVNKGYLNIPYDKLHRVDGPAIVWHNGKKDWRENGKLHRVDGPAVIDPYGNKYYYHYGKLHRVDGPAVEWVKGRKEWWLYGKRHRLDGPAVVHLYGNKGYWINDKKLNTEEVEDWIKDNNINLKTKKHQTLFMVRFG